MKHRLSLLIAAILAIGSPLAFAAESHTSPVTALEKIFTEFEAALNFVRDFDRASNDDSVAFVIELQAGPVELAFLPIEPAPARIKEASCRVPHITMASGYLRHAWIDPNLERERIAQLRNTIAADYILGSRLRSC